MRKLRGEKKKTKVCMFRRNTSELQDHHEYSNYTFWRRDIQSYNVNTVMLISFSIGDFFFSLFVLLFLYVNDAHFSEHTFIPRQLRQTTFVYSYWGPYAAPEFTWGVLPWATTAT